MFEEFVERFFSRACNKTAGSRVILTERSMRAARPNKQLEVFIMKNLSVKKLAGIAAGAVAVLAVIAVVAIFALRVDSSEAQQIALDAAGGGEIISRETSSEGLWNENSYEIVNGDTWYDIEVSGFGHITELESSTSQYPRS